MPCVPRSRAARVVSFWLLVLHARAPCLGRAPPAGSAAFPDGGQEQFMKTVPEYHVVHPARVDASGHFLSFNLHHHISSPRKRRDLGKSENVVYYKINHEEKDLFFNLTVHMGFLSHNYVVERRRGNHTNAKISTHSGVPCHFLGTAWQPGSGSGTAAISTCSGLSWIKSGQNHKNGDTVDRVTKLIPSEVFKATELREGPHCTALPRHGPHGS